MGSLQGDLSVLGLTVLLPNLMEARRQGSLSVSADDEDRSFYLRPPTVHVLGVGRRRPVPLDILLARRELLTDSQRQKALLERRKSGRPLHQVLLDMQIMVEGDVQQTLREYAQEELFEVLSSAKGTFRFLEGPPPSGAGDPDHLAVDVSIELSYVLLEAARRADEWEMIRKAIPSGEQSFRLTPLGADLLAQRGQDKALIAILSLVEKGESVTGIVDQTGLRAFPVWSAMFTLLNQSLVEAQTMRIEPVDLSESDVFDVVQSVPSPVPPKDVRRTESGKKVVLIGDAQAQSRKIVRFLLEREGFHVMEAATGQEVLDALEKIQVHAVLLEMVLPGSDGPDLCRKIKARGPSRDVPVLFLSATSRREDVLRAMQAGARDYIVKPFQKDVLIEKIRRPLAGRV